MSFLIFIALLVVLYSVYKKRDTKSSYEDPLLTRNREWVQYIFGYKKLAKTKDQKELIEKMLSDLAAQGLPMPSDETAEEQLAALSKTSATAQLSQAVVSSAAGMDESLAADSKAKQKVKVQLDNASLLLYFGAFLFVASAGLFVVFAGIPGGVRSFVVMLTALVMYGGGVWLYHNNLKLQQAGLAFAGIGIAIAPLIGLSAYNYIFNQTNGPVVWFGTSVLCLLMYTHALFSLRKPLINYIFILTFLSLFGSGVSIINAPIYYFGWVLAAIGLALTAVSRYKGFWPEFQESSRLSGMVFLPISVLVSVVLVPGHGVAQLGVSLLLAAAYYGLEAQVTEDQTQHTNAIVAQTSLLLGIASIVYATTNSSWPAVAISLIVTGIVQTIFILMWSESSILTQNFASITIVSVFLAIFAALQEPAVVLGTCAVLVLISTVIWIRQKRIDAYVVVVIALMALAIIYGQYFSNPRLNYSAQALLLLASLIVQCIVMSVRQIRFSKAELPTTQLTYLFSGMVVIISSYFATPGLALLISSLIAASMILLIKRQEDNDWAIAAGVFIAAPILWTWNEPRIFLGTMLISLILNILLALGYRKEQNRWISTILWLLLPLALGNINAFAHWNTGTYAWAYLLAMVGLVTSRAIARGVLLISNKIPLASYARNASLSYVVGYWLAAVLAVCLSAAEGKSIQTTAMLTLITLIVWVVSEYVEKQPGLFILIPLLLQGILLSATHPQVGTQSIIVFTLGSTTLAVASYFALMETKSNKDKLQAVRYGALVAIFVTPLSVLFTQQTIWPMPFGLLIASLLVFYHVRSTTQEYRELAGGLIVLAIYWMMYFLGVRNIQVYSHTLVVLFAIYAYWRNGRGEIEESNNYLMVMLATATIPLGLQALSGASGGLYGWWLILEQIVFMLLGMAIGKRFITMWGLYVAVGAVLYQLRNLGWAALTVLALFLIGLAVYRIQKSSDKR